MNRITEIGTLCHPAVKFGNDFCDGLFSGRCNKAEQLPVSGKGKYIYPIFEILN